MNVSVPEYAELKYLKKIKIIDEKNDLGESGYNLFESYLYQQKHRYIFSIYVVCAGQRSSSIPTFIDAIYPSILLITNIEATITTANLPRYIYLQDQKRASVS